MKTRYLAFKVELDGQIPDKIHLIPFGRWRERNHNFTFDETNAEMVLDNFKKSTVDTVIDYEHQTLNAMFNGQPAPAAGWIKELEAKDDGIWCIEIEWNQKAKEHLKNKEYKYLSPVIEFDAQDRITGKPIGTRLHSCGLTNIPFLEELTPIINKNNLQGTMSSFAEASGDREDDMDFAELQKKYNDLVAKNATLEKEKKDLGSKLKVANDKIAAAAVAAAEKEAETIVNKAITDKLIQENQKEWALEICINSRENFDKYLETLKPAETTKEEAETIVNKAIEDKLIFPAQKDWAISLCVANKEMLEDYLKVCTPHKLIDPDKFDPNSTQVDDAYEPEIRK